MKKISLLGLALCGALLTLTGCGTPQIYPPGSTSALGSDHAAVMVNYGGIYGPVKVLRANPGPGQSVTFGADGSFSMTWTATNAVGIVISNGVAMPTAVLTK